MAAGPMGAIVAGLTCAMAAIMRPIASAMSGSPAIAVS